MAKPSVYADIPDFDQCTQYVVQLPPAEREDCVYYGVEVRELPPQDDPNMPL
jgi:hypothetical protein